MNFQATSCCRICLKSELLMSIYLYSPTFLMRPIEMIEKLNIFKSDDSLPTLLCQSCLYRLVDAYNLQQLAEASECRLRGYMRSGGVGIGICGLSLNSVNQESSSFSSTAAIGDTGKDSELTTAMYANICDMFEHNAVHPIDVNAEEGGVVTTEDMLNDVEIDVSSLTRSEANEDTLNEVLAIKRTSCGYNPNLLLGIPESILDMKVRLNSRTDTPSTMFTKRKEQCPECGRTFKYSGYLETHRRTHTGDKPFQCQHCLREFRQSSNLLLHQRTHTGERRFQCEICANFFTTSSNLKAHKTTHLERREHRCRQCSCTFKTLRELRRHEPVHKTVKDHICEKCNKAFTKRSYLTEHMVAMHCGLGRHKCVECEKLFRRRSNLVAHMRVHSGEKPFSCKFCPWKFNQSSALARHMKKHTKSKSLSFHLKDREEELNNTSLINVLQNADVGKVSTTPQINVCHNISNLNSGNSLNSIEPVALVSAVEEQKLGAILRNDYDFTKGCILDFAKTQQVA